MTISSPLKDMCYAALSRLKQIARPAWRSFRAFRGKTRVRLKRAILWGMGGIGFSRRSPDALRPTPRGTINASEWLRSEAAAAANAVIASLDDAHMQTHAPPKTIHPQIRVQFAGDYERQMPASFCLSMPNGRVWRDGFVMTPDGYLLDDLSKDYGKRAYGNSLDIDWAFEEPKRVEGKIAVLATDGAALYYHWIFQLLPRIDILQRSGFQISDLDAFYVNGTQTAFQKETLGAAGVPPDKLVLARDYPHLIADELIVPSIPPIDAAFSRQTCDFLRGLFPPQNAYEKKSSHRIYITRSKANMRRVLNEEALLPVLRKYGFEFFPMESMSVSRQAELMRNCEVVAGPHGGGFTNIVFCEPGTKFIEIFSPELVTLMYWKIANTVGLDYYYLIGEGSVGSQDADYAQSWRADADITVDPDKLEKTLLLAGLG